MGVLLETSPNAIRFWQSGFKGAFGKSKVFGILSQLKKLSKSNDVHAGTKQNVFKQDVTSC